MRIVSVANQKGGCGKSTVAVNLASALTNAGQRVLLIDNDPQGHATLALGVGPDDFHLSTRDLYLTSDVKVEDIRLEIREGLHLVPADVDLATVEPGLAEEPRRVRRLLERMAISEMPYDLVLIDNPPSVGLLTFNALMASGEALVPVDAGRFTLHAVERFQETIDLLALERGHRLRVHLLANTVDLRTNHARRVLEELEERYPGARLETMIHGTVRLREAADLGLPIDRHDRRSRAAADFEALAEELRAFPQELGLEEAERWQDLLHGPAAGAKGVRFAARFPEAARVAVTGDFTEWSVEGVEMGRQEGGLWSVELPMEAGCYEYKFIVDGVWKVDPENPECVRNSYGQLNSVLVVPSHA